jgi:hypothetical protein
MFSISLIVNYLYFDLLSMYHPLAVKFGSVHSKIWLHEVRSHGHRKIE